MNTFDRQPKLELKFDLRQNSVPASNRHIKKQLNQFMKQQLALSKGERAEVYQVKPRQKLRRGPLPDLVLRTMVEQGIRYVIVLHFANFVSIYYADAQGMIVTVKNFDRKRDQHALAELPQLGKRILRSRPEKKEPPKHEQLLKKTEDLQKQFLTKIHMIEKLVGVRIAPRSIPVISLTPQEQAGTIHIPTSLQTSAKLDQFFTTEALRLVIPMPFQLHTDRLVQFLTYMFIEDSTGRIELFEQLSPVDKDLITRLSPESLTRRQIRPLIAQLRWWAKYEDRRLDGDMFNLWLPQILSELPRISPDNQWTIAATVSWPLFQSQGDLRDLLRWTCFFSLSHNQALFEENRTHFVSQTQDDITKFCHAMLTLQFRQLYQSKPQIERKIGPRLRQLLQRAFEQLKTQILDIRRGVSQLILENRSDLDLSTLTLRVPSTPPEEVLVTIPQLEPGHRIEIPLNPELEMEQLEIEFMDNFLNQYRVLI